MQVRMKIGPKAGALVDLPYAAAKHLVEMDQAEDVHGHMRLPKAEVTRIDDVQVELKGEVAASTTGTGTIAGQRKKRK